MLRWQLCNVAKLYAPSAARELLILCTLLPTCSTVFYTTHLNPLRSSTDHAARTEPVVEDGV